MIKKDKGSIDDEPELKVICDEIAQDWEKRQEHWQQVCEIQHPDLVCMLISLDESDID
jgi:hypothetical protein